LTVSLLVRRARALGFAESERALAAISMQVVQIDAESKIGRSLGRRQYPVER
jgi:hypothetical protein